MIEISNSLLLLEDWIEQENFTGFDPFDALNSPILRALSFDNRQIGQVWVQVLKRSPVNMRSLLGVTKKYNPKAMGLFLATYSRMFNLYGHQTDLERAEFFQNWLNENIPAGCSGACWGYNFDWPNRSFYAPAGTPTIVNTGFIGLAFLDYAEALRKTDQPFESAIKTASSAGEFILKDLNRLETRDELCFSYTPIDRRYVHNANLLGAWLLSAVYGLTKRSEYAEKAMKSGRFSARRMESNGSWKYGVNPDDDWVDNFHTGYVLVALKEISKNLGTSEFQSQISRGYEYWKENFFLRGIPKYYPNKIYPIDSHCIAQAILTFLEYSDCDPEAIEWACKAAEWGCENMQDPKGYFYYQKHRMYTNKIPYMRWSEAWMLRALTELQAKLAEQEAMTAI